MRIRTLAVHATTMLVSLAVVPPAEAPAGAEDWISGLDSTTVAYATR